MYGSDTRTVLFVFIYSSLSVVRNVRSLVMKWRGGVVWSRAARNVSDLQGK